MIPVHPARFAAALDGREPAEILLSTRDRDLLVARLHARGWTDVEIAQHTAWTTYTVGRIRGRLHLPANPAQHREAG